MSAQAILSDWKKGVFKSVYWLEGDEPYFIDQLVNYAEHHILSEAAAGFNLTVFYGRDAEWSTVLNTLMRYPMFSDKQVVILKEGQMMKDIGKLESYIEHPLSSTIFIVSYKDKKYDGRSKMGKILKLNHTVFTTKKMYDSELPKWASQMISEKGLHISPKSLSILVDHIGNDLSRIENEIEKLAVNLGTRKEITADDIENFIGVSKEFNVFELQAAIGEKNLAKCIRIIQYFESNPKAAPIVLVIPAIYNFFSKIYMLHSLRGQSDAMKASTLAVNPFFLKDYKMVENNYSFEEIEKILLLLHHYNLRSIGINQGSGSDASLLKELVVKIIA